MTTTDYPSPPKEQCGACSADVPEWVLTLSLELDELVCSAWCSVELCARRLRALR